MIKLGSRICHSSEKTSTNQFVPLQADILLILLRRWTRTSDLEPDDKVFEYSYSQLQRRLQKFLRVLTLDHLGNTQHSLRH